MIVETRTDLNEVEELGKLNDANVRVIVSDTFTGYDANNFAAESGDDGDGAGE